MIIEQTNNDKHNAFTDLKYYKNEWYLCFRVATKHMWDKAEIHIYKSKDGKEWSYYSRTIAQEDIRDPRFMVYDDTLYLLVNYLTIKDDRVKTSYLLKGVVREGITGTYKTGDVNCFITSVLGTLAFSYNPVTNGDIRMIGLQEDVALPFYLQFTEGTLFYKSKSEIRFFIRNDIGNSYWLVKTKGYDQLIRTNYIIHCPLIIEDGKYLLGREMKESGNKFDIVENMKTAELWVYEIKGFELKKKKRLEGFGDCGYFGYANGLISYNSSYDITKLEKTAVYIKKLK